MGYWEMGEGGASFVPNHEDPDNQMIWGDGPADAIGNAIAKIKVEFVRDLGRMPSRKEIINGILFSTRCLDELAEEPKDAPCATPEQMAVMDEYGIASVTPLPFYTREQIRDSQDMVRPVLYALELDPPIIEIEDGPLIFMIGSPDDLQAIMDVWGD